MAEGDVIEDPDSKGFWTTLSVWKRWRHETYQDDREAEKQYLDELPAAPAAANRFNIHAFWADHKTTEIELAQFRGC